MNVTNETRWADAMNEIVMMNSNELKKIRVDEYIAGVNRGFRELGYDHRVVFVPAKFDNPDMVCLTFGYCGTCRDELRDICLNIANGVASRIGCSVSAGEIWCNWSSEEVHNRDVAVMVMIELANS